MELKKKIGWFLVLIVVVCGTLFVNNTLFERKLTTDLTSFSSSEYSYTDDYNYDSYESDKSDSAGFFVAIFIEAFVSIHMSAFVLSPLSKIFGKEKHSKVFIILFAIRVIVLLIGDFIAPEVTMMVDFFAVFIGAFLVVPICAALFGIRLDSKSNQPIVDLAVSPRTEVSDTVLASLGFGDKEIVKKGLVQHYIDIINYYNKKDYSNLVKLCSPGVYTSFKTELELYDKANETKVIDDISCDNVIIVSASKQGRELYIDLKVNYSCFEYVLDQYNSVIRGSKVVRKNYSKVIYFSKKVGGNFITTCPNCNASINEDGVEYCSYCGTALNFNIGDWILKKETILDEE